MKLSYIPKVKGYHPVDKYLIRGGMPSVKNLINLKREGVTQIYDFRHNNIFGFKFIEANTCKFLGIDYKRRKFNLFTRQNPKLEEFEEVASAIKQNGERGGKSFLHCSSGRHRTGQMVTFYELTKGNTLEQTRKMYPRTYPFRIKILLNKLINEGNYFDRDFVENLSKNPIQRIFQKRNNKVFLAISDSLEAFTKLLLKENF